MKRVKRQEKNKGITLIALIVTIIVLLILAGITIGALTGNNGTIEQANAAKTQTEIAQEMEILDIATVNAMGKDRDGNVTKINLDSELDKSPGKNKYDSEEIEEGIVVTYRESKRSYLVDTDGNVIEYIKREPEPKPEDSTLSILDPMTYGVIEIEFLEGTGYNISSKPNEPILKDGMKLVEYNGTNWQETTYNADKYYKAQITATENGGTSYWANAQTADGSFYVWIPRYAYRIIYFKTEDAENKYRNGSLTEEEALKQDLIVGYSDARGIVDKQGKRPTKIAAQTAIKVNDKYFKLHPAFSNDPDLGGWDSQLSGIWIAKFEASKPEATDSSSGNGIIPKSVPGVLSWRGFQKAEIGLAYTYSKDAYNKNGELNTILNSHLMKNSEWGAVAYLTESKYGRNGTEVTANNSYITGAAQIDTGTEKDYTSEKGQLASSTGNLYGVYDLSGHDSYVAAYYKYSTNSQLSNGKSFAKENGISDKYSTVYESEDISDAYKYGDATLETKNWNNDYLNWITETFCFINRGDGSTGKTPGIFLVHYSTGQGTSYTGFRVCLSIKEK